MCGEEQIMSQPLSLFPTYSSKENRTTNYCGLMLMLMYRESPKAFEQAMNELLSDQVALSCVATFEQQEKTQKSIPDLTIAQQSFRLFFENKLNDWHNLDQAKRHLVGLAKEGQYQTRVLFLMAADIKTSTTKLAESLNSAAESDGTGFHVQSITYSQFYSALCSSATNLSPSYRETLDDFEKYLEREDLLYSWKQRFVSVLMTKTKGDIDQGLYQCGLDTKALKRRCHYFGAYWDKGIKRVGVVTAVLTFDPGTKEHIVEYKNDETDEKALIEEAKKRLRIRGYDLESKPEAKQIFLIDHVVETEIQKEDPGSQWARAVYANTKCDTFEQLKKKIEKGATYRGLIDSTF